MVFLYLPLSYCSLNWVYESFTKAPRVQSRGFCASARYNITMTAPIFSRAKASAIRQLRLWPLGKGSSLTLNQVTGGGEYIPGGGESAPTVTSSLGSGIRTMYALKDIDGTLVQASDVRFLVCPVRQDGVTDMPVPQTGDTITFGDTTYNVVTCKPWDFDGVTQIGFVVQGRI